MVERKKGKYRIVSGESLLYTSMKCFIFFQSPWGDEIIVNTEATNIY